jgi:hypothetical protein
MWTSTSSILLSISEEFGSSIAIPKETSSGDSSVGCGVAVRGAIGEVGPQPAMISKITEPMNKILLL